MIEIKAIRRKLRRNTTGRRKNARNSAAVIHKIARVRNIQDGLETSKMTATKAPTQRQQSQSQEPQVQYGDLDRRYGKIGISAVAGAVRHKGERQQAAPKPRYVQHDSD